VKALLFLAEQSAAALKGNDLPAVLGREAALANG
jgi:hypothetical protein